MSKQDILGLLDESQNAKVLDVGCNNGAFTKEIAEKINTPMIIGLEINEECAKVAYTDNHVKVILADANYPFPFNSDTFDVVVSNDVLEHVSNTDSFICEMYRVLRKGGYCVCSTPNLAGIHNIASLMLGYQPPTLMVSDVVACGNPLNPCDGEKYPPFPGFAHRRVFTAVSLKALFQFHGFRCQKLVGTGLHPLPLFIQRHTKISRYSALITIKAFKS
jgi:SAM-dependent methyltransferase